MKEKEKSSTYQIPSSAMPGPLLQWVMNQQSVREKKEILAPERKALTSVSEQSRKRQFIIEFESLGDVAAVCDVVGCTLVDVRRWRTMDAMFERDFALAAMAHVRELKRMVGALTDNTDAACQLLRREPEFVGPDGRLDVRAWRDALWEFLRRTGVDPLEWEPEAQPSIA